jgi:hypothetical protein
VHALTAPSATSTNYYFIPNWGPNQKLYFPTAPTPNVSSPELLDTVPASVLPTGGGIIEARTQLWSDQVAQAAEPTKFDVKAEAIARGLIDEAYDCVSDAVRPPRTTRGPFLIPGPVIPPKVPIPDNSPLLARAKSAAKRAVAILPASSALVAEANAIATDPAAALRDLRKKQMDDFLQVLAPQKSRAGVWMIRKPGGMQKISTAGGRSSALGAGADKAGKVTLIIDARGAAGEISATLINPDQPNVKRKLNGRLHVDASANRLILALHAPFSGTRAPTEADIKTVTTWTRLLLEQHGNDLRGLAEVGAGDNALVLQIGFDPPQDVKK